MHLEHLFEALSPMLFVSFLTGTSPIYPTQENGKYSLKVSQVFKMISIFYISIYTCNLVYGTSNLNTSTNIKYFGNTMSSIGLVLDSIGQILLIYIIYIFSFIMPTNMKNVIDKIAVIDSVLHELGYKNNYNKTFWQQVILLFTGIFSIIIAILTQFYIISTQSMFRLNDALWFVYYFPIVVIFIMECQFSFTVFLIYQRLQIINNLLNETSSKVNMQKRKEYSKLTIMKGM